MPPTNTPAPKVPTIKVRFTEDTCINLGEGKFSAPYKAGKTYQFAEPTGQYWIGRGVAVPVGDGGTGIEEPVDPTAGGGKGETGLAGLSIAELRALAKDRNIALGNAQTREAVLEVVTKVLEAQS